MLKEKIVSCFWKGKESRELKKVAVTQSLIYRNLSSDFSENSQFTRCVRRWSWLPGPSLILIPVFMHLWSFNRSGGTVVCMVSISWFMLNNITKRNLLLILIPMLIQYSQAEFTSRLSRNSPLIRMIGYLLLPAILLNSLFIVRQLWDTSKITR